MRTQRGCCRRKLSTSHEEQSSTERSSGGKASIYANQTITRQDPRFRNGRVTIGVRSHSMHLDIDDRLLYLAAVCGFVLALGALFAPQSGRQARQNLTNRVEDLTHKVQD